MVSKCVAANLADHRSGGSCTVLNEVKANFMLVGMQ